MQEVAYHWRWAKIATCGHHRREDLTWDRVNITRNLQLSIRVLELIEIQALMIMEELKMEHEAKKSGAGSEEEI
ncbi:unnamed protein product, partial [Vitis vinifera]